MDRLEKAEWLREQAEKAKWYGHWGNGEELEARAEALEYGDDD
ncbi:hypothetical protein [Streptomyces xanthophaeus]